MLVCIVQNGLVYARTYSNNKIQIGQIADNLNQITANKI